MMNRSTNISIERLSAPVEMLDLDMRACRGLRRAGIHTVAEVLLAGRQRLTSARNIASRTADRIFEALRAYLGLPTDCQVYDAPAQPGSPFDPLAAPIDVLQLPASTLQELRSMGMFRVNELLSSRPNEYGIILGLGEAEIRWIDIQLDSYLAGAAHAFLQRLAGGEAIPEPSVPAAPPKRDLGSALQTLALGEGDWSVLELGSWSSLSLEQIGARDGGIRPERAGQILARAKEIVQDKLVFLSNFLDLFKQKSNTLRGALEDHSPDRHALIRGLLPGACDPYLTACPEDVERTIVIVRTIAMHPRRWFVREMEPRWPAFIFLSCLIEPAIQRHPPVSQTILKWKRTKKRKTCKQLTYEVLAARGQAMHWTEVTEEVRRLSAGHSVAARSVQERLNYHKKLFVLLGPGTYGLAKWGHRAVESYPQIIARVLRQEGRPLSFDVLFDRVSAIRPVTESSLKMNLSMHPRFYRTMDPQGTYGLRGWLHRGESHGSPTPGWSVEHPTSVKRVERARAKRLDIDKMIREDMLA
jgi:hypothetical protein